MGDCGNIKLMYPQGDIYFYTHWDGSELHLTLAEALKRGKGRWDDPPYLARIIFSEMIRGDVLGQTGYGISPSECDSGPLPTVDLKAMTVRFNAMTYTYQEFVDAFAGT